MFKDVGVELRRLREKAGLKQKDVAAHLGYTSSQFISNWERGISCPPLKSIKTLAKVYNTSPQKLFQKISKAINDNMQKEFDQSVG